MNPVRLLADSDAPAALVADLAEALRRGAPDVGGDRATARREATLAVAEILAGDAAAARVHLENLLADDPVGGAARADGLAGWARRLRDQIQPRRLK